MIGKPRAATGAAAALDRPLDEPAPADRSRGEGPPRAGVLRTVLGVVVLSAIAVVGAGAIAVQVLPVDRWLAGVLPQHEVTGRVTAVTVEQGAHRGFARRWRSGSGDRLVLRVAPYSFGFYHNCRDAEECRALRGRIARGDAVAVAVDKRAFDELAATNRTVGPKVRSIDERARQALAAQFDERRLRLNRLARGGETLIAD